MMSQEAASSSNTFWPRRPTVPQPINEDLYCDKCGYNLRGLMPRGRCPECGYAYRAGIQRRSTFPWPRRAKLGLIDAYCMTVWMVLRHPRQFGQETFADEEPLEWRDGTLFRWITIALAIIPLLILFLLAARSQLTDARRLLLLPLGATGMLVLWLEAITWKIIGLFASQNLDIDHQNRLEVLSHYTAAPLVLCWIHPVMLMAVQLIWLQPDPLLRGAVLAIWGLIVLGHLVLWLNACGSLARESTLMEPEDLAHLSVRIILIWTGYTLLYLAALPATLYWFAQSILHII
jgi:hypothetical protein